MTPSELYRLLEAHTDNGLVSLPTRRMAMLSDSTPAEVRKNLNVLIAQGSVYRLAEPIRSGKRGRPAVTYRLGGEPSGEVTR